TRLPVQSACGCAFSSLGRPWVAQRVWPIPKAPFSGSACRFSSRLRSLPTERRRVSEPFCTTAMPAESYPRYSSLRSPSTITGTASRDPTYPTIPHMWLVPRRRRNGSVRVAATRPLGRAGSGRGGGGLGVRVPPLLARPARVGPAGLDLLPRAAQGERARGHVLGDRAARGHVGALTHGHRGHQRGVAADEGPGL